DDPEPTGVKRLFGAVALVDLDTPPLLVVPEVAGLRIFAGYSGWSPGQLEDEVRTGSWFVVDAEGGDAFTQEPDALWVAVLRRQPAPLQWVAWFPADPTQN
ncbi:MAG: YqgE/AlgH family protein, partial [Acidimicrobiales bacterium]